VLLAGALALPSSAQAGGLRIRDDAHVLTADDATRLRSVLAAAPFDGRFVLTTDYPDPQELSRFADTLVTEPNLVAVAVDPQHRHVQVHFGTRSGVPRAERDAIEHAGNDAFRRGDWEGGAAAIFRAAASSAASGASDASPAAQDQARPSLFGPGLLFLLLAGGIGIAYFAWRRSTYGRGYGAPTYGPPGGPYAGQGYPPAGYPGAGPQGGLGPLGGGLLGAGLGGLAGYELGKLEGEREERERDSPVDRGGVIDDGGNYDDGGGGGSSWSDDGGGFDGGGGDSGGGSDF
jgi:hypothetical protein